MTTSQSVTRTINAPAGEIFDLLSNPERHPEFDGSGFLRSAVKPQRISAVGDTFSMNMVGDHMGGEYQTDNTVTGYQENKMLVWQTAPADQAPPGWEWMWELAAEGSGATTVTLTYDWAKVTDKDLLKTITFPLVSESQLEDSLNALAEQVAS